jgi:hypothetical protein
VLPVQTLRHATGIVIEYCYAFCERLNDNALVIFRVENIDHAVEVLSANQIQVVPSTDVYAL